MKWYRVDESKVPQGHGPIDKITFRNLVSWGVLVPVTEDLMTRAEWEASISGPLYRPGPKFDHPVLQRELRDIVAHGGLLEEDS